MTRPRLLDLFCGAGGAAMGYSRAGFDVVGVDINPQPHYPFEFHQADAMTYPLEGFDVIHASPPCQAYTRKTATWGRARVNVIEHPDLLGPIRDRLSANGAPYIIENVPGAPIAAGMLLCGTMFGLAIRKHRYFETNWPMPILAPSGCNHEHTYDPWSGAGRTTQKLRDAQGTPWIPMHSGSARAKGITGDLNNAIPPAYTEWIGGQLLAAL
jgi:hypothetical protein